MLLAIHPAGHGADRICTEDFAMYESVFSSFPGGLFSEFDRLRRELDDVFGVAGLPGSIRSVAPGAFPAINVGNTPTSVEIYAFAPGLDPSKIEVQIDRGVLTLSGERVSPLPSAQEARDKRLTVYSQERVFGRFQRAITLPEDADPAHVNASYRDGVLHVSIARRESAQPRRIAIQ
jgi:HSP20 family protein